MASNQEQAVIDAAKTGDADKLNAAYSSYVAYMNDHRQTPKSMGNIVG